MELESPYLSKRSLKIEYPDNFCATERANKRASHGLPIIKLTVGQPHLPPPRHIEECLLAACKNPAIHRYPPPTGVSELKSRVAYEESRVCHQTFDHENVLISVGAKGAISLFFEAVLNQEDEVVMASPYWSGFEGPIVKCGGKLRVVSSLLGQPGLIHAESLKSIINSKTKVVVINSPSNPCGQVYSEEDLAAIAKVLRSCRVPPIVLSDEVYEHLTYPNVKHIPASSIITDSPVITVSGWSKSYALTGHRVGFACGPKDVISRMKILQSIGSYPSTLAQHLALASYSDNRAFPRLQAGLYYENWKILENYLIDLRMAGLTLISRPQAGFNAWFSVQGDSELSNGDRAEAFFLDTVGVALASGKSFGDPLALRMSFSVSGEILEMALKRLCSLRRKWI